MIALAPSPFEQFARENGYNITPAVSPCPARAYADSRTQEIFEAWTASGAHFARMIADSTIETPALVEKVREMARAG